MLRWSAFLLLILLFGCSSSEKSKRILFCGDLLLDRGVREKIEYLGIESLFDPSVDSVFKGADLVLANLECPATSIEEPINKQFIFRAEPDWLSGLKSHGITHLTLANNHSMDQGRAGLRDTYKNILQQGMIPLGFGSNEKEACEPFVLLKSPQKVLLFSSVQIPSENWVYMPNEDCVCEESFTNITDRIVACKKNNPDCLVWVQLHWGVEHVKQPQAKQKAVAHQLIDAGADLIIGHHPHVVQTVEVYKQKYIFYSIGNFIFDQSKPINSKGIMVQIDLNESGMLLDTLPYNIEKCKPVLTGKDD